MEILGIGLVKQLTPKGWQNDLITDFDRRTSKHGQKDVINKYFLLENEHPETTRFLLRWSRTNSLVLHNPWIMKEDVRRWRLMSISIDLHLRCRCIISYKILWKYVCLYLSVPFAETLAGSNFNCCDGDWSSLSLLTVKLTNILNICFIYLFVYSVPLLLTLIFFTI